MSSRPLPTVEQARSLTAAFDLTVPQDTIDENGHMNITAYFEYGAWAPWRLIQGLGMGEDYIEERGHSFFTVEHHIRYLGELRLGEPFTVRAGLAGRAAMAVHAVSYVVDEGRDRLACVLEVMYLHVSMGSRRSAPIPDDLAAAIDAEAARTAWVAASASGLELRR